MATPSEIRAVKEFKESLINDLGYYMDAGKIESYYLQWLGAQMDYYEEEPLITPEIITRVVAV